MKLLAEHLKPKNKVHEFDSICLDNNIQHRLTRFKHPWTNGQVEVFCRVLKDHTTKAYHYDSIEQLKHHIMSFLLLYNYQKKLKSLNYKTPYDIIVDNYNIKPYLFKDIPTKHLHLPICPGVSKSCQSVLYIIIQTYLIKIMYFKGDIFY